MGWRDYAKQIHDGRDNRVIRDNSGQTSPNVPIVPNVPPLDPGRALKLCQKGLDGCDPVRPLHNLDPARWRRLLDDAQWLLDAFGSSAFHDGWTVGELFGLWWYRPDGGDQLVLKDGWGGIADRLQGSRSLKLTPDRAYWRRMFTGEPDVLTRSAYPDLKPLWETSR